jgi:hypothetical protein
MGTNFLAAVDMTISIVGAGGENAIFCLLQPDRFSQRESDKDVCN